MLVGSTPGLADEAGRMRVIDHNECVVSFGEVTHSVKLGDVAVHRECAVGGNHPETLLLRLLELLLEIVHVEVLEPMPLRLAQSDAVDDRCVVQLVRDIKGSIK